MPWQAPPHQTYADSGLRQSGHVIARKKHDSRFLHLLARKIGSATTAEVERYFVNPGQALAYQIGMLKILELRERARQIQGPRFELKQFHNEVLSHGALPLPVLEQTIDQWIASRQKSVRH